MPYLKLQSNIEIEDESKLIQEISQLIAGELGKPESYVMVVLEPELSLSFGGNMEPAAWVELKSIGLSGNDNNELSSVICGFLKEELGIAQERIYINFADISSSNWGWNGSTF